MKLHQDIDAFRILIEDIHNKTGYRTDVLEKDYYVVLMLAELAKKQNDGLPAYFKGGTNAVFFKMPSFYDEGWNSLKFQPFSRHYF